MTIDSRDKPANNHRCRAPTLENAAYEFHQVLSSIFRCRDLVLKLELVIQKEARVSGRRRIPGPQVLKRLGEMGDIRNAVASLEFLCVKGDDEADWGAKVAFTKPKRAPIFPGEWAWRLGSHIPDQQAHHHQQDDAYGLSTLKGDSHPSSSLASTGPHVL